MERCRSQLKRASHLLKVAMPAQPRRPPFSRRAARWRALCNSTNPAGPKRPKDSTQNGPTASKSAAATAGYRIRLAASAVKAAAPSMRAACDLYFEARGWRTVRSMYVRSPSAVNLMSRRAWVPSARCHPGTPTSNPATDAPDSLQRKQQQQQHAMAENNHVYRWHGLKV
ncbi:unnamed protein product [Polarella glacialis]|uniref:Uncharacterized protein n=1 Tax=Polarella glacialis TaxID=89957 RepID=A0A813GKS5_POLGL|nr:unnamed protein product [Polarella glacialis]